MNTEEQATRRNVSFYQVDYRIVRAAKKKFFRPSFSDTIRFILRTWAQQHPDLQVDLYADEPE